MARRRYFSGPGLIVTAAFIGPGTVTSATLAGADFGYALLWALAFATLATICLQYMAARVAIVSRMGLAEAILSVLPHGGARFAMAGLLLLALAIGNAAYEAGNIGGSYLGLETVFPAIANYKPQIICIMALALTGIIALGQIKLLERILVALVAVMSLSFIASMFWLPIDWAALFMGFAPALPDGSLFTAIALIGTTVVPYNLFLHAAMARDRWGDSGGLGEARDDAVLSISLGGLISMAILASAAATLFGTGITVSNGGDMAAQLEPLFGPLARNLFGIGLMAAGVTSAITAPMATGYVMREIVLQFRPDIGQSTAVFKCTAIAVILCGAAAVLTGADLLAIILTAQMANGLLLPLVAVLLVRIANSRALLGNAVNGRWLNAGGVLVIGVTLLLGTRMVLRSLGIWP